MNSAQVYFFNNSSKSITLSKSSTFYQYLDGITPQVCKNLNKYVGEQGLGQHINYFIFVPAQEHENIKSLVDRQNYCYEFSQAISIGNIDLMVSGFYLDENMKPHWLFKIEYICSDDKKLDLEVTFNDKEIVKIEIMNFCDENYNEINLDIDSPDWNKELTWFWIHK